MPSRTVEIILKAADQFSDTTKKGTLEFAAMRIQADELAKSVEKLQKLHPGLSAQEVEEVAKALQDAQNGAENAGKGFANANIAARGLSQELGIVLPRAVTQFLGQSQLIGPALSAAFSTVAVIGMIEALSQIPKLYDKMAGAISGWNEEAKKAYNEQIELNQKAMKAVLDYNLAISTAKGKEGENVGIIGASLTEAQKRLTALQNEKNPQIPSEALNRRRRSGDQPLSEFTNIRSVAEIDEDIKHWTKYIEVLKELDVQEKKNADTRKISEDKRLGDEFDKSVSEGRAQEANQRLQERKRLLEENTRLAYEFDKALTQGYQQEYERDEQLGLQFDRALTQGYEEEFRQAKELGDQFDAAVSRGLEEEARAQIQLDKENERLGYEFDKALEQGYEQQRKKQEEFIKTFQEGVGKAWDSFFLKGKGAFGDLINLGKEMLQSLTRNLVEGFATSLVFGGTSGISKGLNSIVQGLPGIKSGGIFGGLIGAANAGPWSEKIPGSGGGVPGASGILGSLGGLFGGPLGAGTSMGTGPLAGAVVSAPAGGLMGALGLGGGAGLLGLGAATIPVIGGIAAGAALIAMEIFGHHHDAPFTRDPNAIQNTREYLFYSGVQDFAKASKDMLDFTHQLNTLPTGTLVKQGLPVALASSNQFRRDVSATLLQDH